MKIEVDTDYSILLKVMNRHEYPDVKVHVYVIRGRGGELHVTTRPVEAWQRWAETNGFDDWGDFAETYEDQIEWSNDWRKGSLDDGGSMEYVEVEGYYRDGLEHL